MEKSKLRVFEAFSGIGAQRKALENLGIDHEVVAISEIDKHAIASYEAMFGETLNVGDITTLDPHDIPDHDLFTYSSPCQDISIAGKIQGFDEGSELKHIADLEISNRQDLNRVYDPSGIAPTLNTMQGGHRQPKIIQADGGRVRKLTPLECWRLMGFEDSDFEKAARVNSNSQLYKQAGNSIVVLVLEGIFENLFLQKRRGRR